MTFGELMARAAVLAEVGGFSDTENPPDWARMVNLAYAKFCWEADAISGSATLTSVANQAEYVIPAPDFKLITDVTIDGRRVYRGSEKRARASSMVWMDDTSGTPWMYWMAAHQTVRLYPTITLDDAVIVVRGIRGPSEMVLAEATPSAVPDVYHEEIAALAYALHARRMARGAELSESIERYVALAAEAALQFKQHLAGAQELGSVVGSGWPESERVTL